MIYFISLQSFLFLKTCYNIFQLEVANKSTKKEAIGSWEDVIIYQKLLQMTRQTKS